eukprot:Ihof_evm1s375 gene=Ihof_evmTU1s375
MSGSVTVLWEGRRHTINITPNSVLTSVLEQICRKIKVPSNQYTLKFQNKPVNLSLTLRLANIPNNAKLELLKMDTIRKAQDVTLIIQLPDGKRVNHVTSSSTLLWKVLCDLEARPELVETCITRRHGPREDKEVYEQPVLLILNQRYGHTPQDLASTTIEATGVTEGSAVVRLTFQQTDLPWEDMDPILLAADQITNEHKVIAVQAAESVVDNQPLPQQQILSKSTSTNTRTEIKTATPPIPTNDSSSLRHDTQSNTSLGGGTRDSFQTNSSNQTGFEPMDWEKQRMTTRPGPIARQQPQTIGDIVGFSLASEPMSNEEAMPFKEFKFPKKTVSINTTETNSNTGGSKGDCVKIGEPINRNVAVFELDSAPTTNSNLPDEFYNVTVDDVKILLKQRTAEKKAIEEKPLVTSSLRDQNTIADKIANHQEAVMRFQFPDRRVLQGNFHPSEPLSNVFEFVRQHIYTHMIGSFTLSTSPPYRELVESKTETILKASLFPAVLIHFKTPMN